MYLRKLLPFSFQVSFFAAFILFSITSSVSTAYSQSLWSSAQTWPNGQVPKVGDIVEVPAGKTIILDTITPTLGGLTIKGKLKFEDFSNPELVSEWIMVTGSGSSLEIGTESQPYNGQATITLVGTDETKNVMNMNMGNKFIVAANGGTLDIHGASRSKLSWTQLSKDLMPGDSMMNLLKNPVNWTVGDRIAIAPSSWEAEETEVVTVTSVTENTVSFTPPVQFQHLAHTSEYAGKFLDQRAEVGLLNRNILIQGAEDSLASNYGGHLMVMPNSFARIEGAEFYRMGQAGHKARYPIHWHLLDRITGQNQAGAGQYASRNSIHESFQRAIVVHGTGGVLVEDNVSYDIINHAFVPSEDGDEVGNKFIHNVGFFQRSPSTDDFAFPHKVSTGIGSHQGEGRSSTFWFRNPNNVMEGNHAAGGVRSNGFFFDLRGTKPVSNEYIDSTASGVMPFKDNLAHSFLWPSKRHGAANGYPEQTKGHGFLANRTGATLKIFQDFTAYKNFSGVWIDGRSGVLKDSIVADNGSGLVFHRAQAEDVVIVGESEIHTPGDSKPVIGRWGPSGAVHIFDEHLKAGMPKLKNITFINHPDRPAIFHTPKTMGADASFEGLKFINTPHRFFLMDERSSIKYWGYSQQAYLDKDGSLTNTGLPTYLVRRFSALVEPGMKFDEKTLAVSILKENVAEVWMRNTGGHTRSDGQIDYFTSGNSIFNSFDSFFHGKDELKNFALFNTGYSYSVGWKKDDLPSSDYSFKYKAAKGKFNQINFAFPQPISVTINNSPIISYSSIEELQQGQQSGQFYNSNTGHLSLKVFGSDNIDTIRVISNGAWKTTNSPFPGRAARQVSSIQTGLDYRYFSDAQNLDLQEIQYMDAEKSGAVKGFDLSNRTNDYGYAFVFEGFIKIPESGRYLFSVGAEGDADFYIDNTIVTGVRKGRIYIGNRLMKNGERGLAAGYHPVRINYRQTQRHKRHEVGIFIKGPKDENFRLLKDDEFYRGKEAVTVPPVIPTPIPTLDPVNPEQPDATPVPGPTTQPPQPEGTIPPAPPSPTLSPDPEGTVPPQTSPTPTVGEPEMEFKKVTLSQSQLSRSESVDGSKAWGKYAFVKGYKDDGSMGTVYSSRKLVSVTGGRYKRQIDYNATSKSSEVLAISFVNEVRAISLNLGKMVTKEWNELDETGVWKAYSKQGELVSSGVLKASDGKKYSKYGFTFDIELPSSVSKITLEATAYGSGVGVDRVKNNSDFNVEGITIDILAPKGDETPGQCVLSKKKQQRLARLEKRLARAVKKGSAKRIASLGKRIAKAMICGSRDRSR